MLGPMFFGEVLTFDEIVRAVGDSTMSRSLDNHPAERKFKLTIVANDTINSLK